MTFFSKKHKNERGFTELYAVLVGSLILSIGLAILNITLKEFLLSSSARESQIAFYSADAGTECALYWDLTNQNGSAFLASTNSGGVNITCNNQAPQLVGGSGNILPCTGIYSSYAQCESSTFSLTNPVVDVTVKKLTKDLATGEVYTIIDSKGYNALQGTSNRVERAIRVNY